MKNLKFLLIILSLFLTNCTLLRSIPQESKFMKVTGSGVIIGMASRQAEQIYGININFKNLPKNAKYLIADFELPNNHGIYERKIFTIKEDQPRITVNSDPIYGAEYGFYYVKVALAEDKKGEKIIDSLKQSVQIAFGISKGRDYAAEYTVSNKEKEVEKVLIIYPNNRNKNLISARVPAEFKMRYAAVGVNESIVEYVPNDETVFNWNKIITLKENKAVNKNIDKPAVYANALGNAFHKKFSKLDKDIQVTYAGIVDGKFVNTETPNFQNLILGATEVGLYTDYADSERIKKFPNQREYLVARFIKSDISVWEFQCTVRYDKRWSKEKIDSLKKEAKTIIGSFEYVTSNPIDKIISSDGVDNDIDIQIQRLDDRDLNKKFKN